MPKTPNTTEARQTRKERARILGELEEGIRDITELLGAPPEAVEGADLWVVLLRVPNLGRKGIETMCTRARVWPHRRLRELLPHEVRRLQQSLPESCL